MSGEPILVALQEELGSRRLASEGQAVDVATAITNFERDDIPGGLNGTQPPAALDGAGPGTPAVERALIAWIDVLVRELDPDYLNVAVELDLAVAKRPDLRDDLIRLYRRLYAKLKLVSDTAPQLRRCTTHVQKTCRRPRRPSTMTAGLRC